MNIPLYSEEQIRQIEKIAEENGINTDILMQRAGQAAFNFMREHWLKAKTIVVFCGSGNNGGDGYVLAHLAHKRRFTVKIRYVGDLQHLKGPAFNAMQVCEKAGINLQPFDPQETLEADVFVDALLGVGLRGEVYGITKDAIQYINNNQTDVLSIDLPSGIDADTGLVMGVAVKANCTVTFPGIKQGLFIGEALDYRGQISPKDLDLPQSIFDQVQYRTSGVFRHSYISWLKPRSKWTHKGQFGHVLIVGGDYGMNGAPRLAALGAARTGAGLVTIATRPEHAVTMNINYPELMCHGVKNGRELKPLLSKATVVVIGPGLGQSGWAKSLYKTVLSSDLPLVVDADALNLLARNPFSRTNWILTPHPGEAARLLGTTSKQIEADRLKTVLSLQKQYGGICVLKGARTIIADEGQHPIICMAGNPGMASAGMGDLLSGVIGSLAAQGLPWWIAAELGVCLHAEAGDVASMDGERGMLASDLLPLLRFLANDLEPDKKSD